MAHRIFRDPAGTEWEVWDVHPSLLEILAAHQGGWLAFQSRHERRRLEPIPPGWEARSPAELTALLQAALPLGPRRRLAE